jgi:2,3-bisphosphoglycerate-dependent phosphoglycerate mutase
MSSSHITEIFLIRHGHPQQGTGIPYDRAPGPPLSDVGREEARIAGLFLGHMGIRQLFCSPLDRALQTAELIGAALSLTPQVAPLLAEHRREETFDDVRKRAGEFLALLDEDTPQHTQQRVALVTHGSPIKALLLLLSNDSINLDNYKFSNGNHAPTAGVWHARRVETGWQLDLIFKPIVAAPVGHVAV